MTPSGRRTTWAAAPLLVGLAGSAGLLESVRGPTLSPPAPAARPVRARVLDEVLVHDVRRLGVNLGTWRSWGAEQLGREVLQNPGFEGTIDRALVVVRRADATGFTDDDRRQARPDGFWRGATFEVRTGPSAGRSGRIAASHAAGPDGFPSFETEGAAPAFDGGEVIALTRIDDSALPARWEVEGDSAVVGDDIRPGSPGRRSLAVRVGPARSARISYHLDGISRRAGRMLPFDGRWKLSFWARGAAGSPALRVRLWRDGAPAMLERTVEVEPRWRRTEIEFSPDDTGPPAPAQLRFEVTGAGELRLDDAELVELDGPPGAFRSAVVDALRALRPSFLRDWQGSQGATLANRTAPLLARRMVRASTRTEETIFETSIGDLLDLCAQVGASPWIVAPTTWSDSEWRALGEMLRVRAPTERFGEVIVEFGNENWNPLSRTAGISDPIAHGAAASRAFGLLRGAAGPGVALRTAVNGQFANPRAAVRVARETPGADLLAVAPYFLYDLDSGLTSQGRLDALFPDASGNLGTLSEGNRGGTELAVYEVNLHATGGNAPPAERDPVVAGAASGTAFARRVLDTQAAGARRIAAYELAGYDAFTKDRGLTKLWGLVRDLGGTRRLRPTGLAVSLLDRAMEGNRHGVVVEEDGLTVAAYRSQRGWSVVVASSRPDAAAIDLALPTGDSAPSPRTRLVLESPGPWHTNEDAEEVRIREAAIVPGTDSIRVDVPPAGLVVLVPDGTA